MRDAFSHRGDGDRTPLVEDVDALRSFVAAMPSLIVMLDDSERILAYSDRWHHLFISDEDVSKTEAGTIVSTEGDGLTSSVPTSRERGAVSFSDVFLDPDGTWSSTLKACLADDRARRGYVRPLSRPDGTTYWVDWEVRPWQAPAATEPSRGLLVSLTDRTGQHQAEVARKQLEQRFDALIETIREGVLLMDQNGVFRDANEAAQDILGRSLDDIVGSRYNDDTWKGLREDGTPLPNGEFPFWRAYVERETVPNEIMGIYPHEGPPRWIQVNAQPLFHDDEEDPYAVLVCFDDVTDEKLKEEALQTSRDLLSSVLTSSLDGITVLSALRNDSEEIVDFECVLVNPQAEKMIGRSAEDVVGKRLRTVMPEQEEMGLLDAYRTVVETGQPLETEVRYETDAIDAWIHVMAVSVGDGVAVTFRDVSERKEAEQRIREQAQLLDRARDAILAYDMNGRIVYWNKGAERLTGWSKDEVLGERTHACLYDPEEEGKLQHCHETMMEEGEWKGELRMRTEGGDERIVESRWTLVRGSSGAPKQVLVINTDVTERKRLESQFLRSQRMESIGRLVGGIAHDLGNLLMPITLGVKVLRRRIEQEDEKIDRTLSMIQKSAERGSNMVEQVLTFARGVEGERVALQVGTIIEEVEGITEETFPDAVSVRTDVSDDLPRIVGDATQIQQVLMNLCVNARDAMPDGGTLAITAEAVEFSEADAQRNIDAEPGRYLCVQVEDSGIGMPDDVVDKIFEPFFSTKAEGEGTGLGLSTAYSIVQSHGGFIDVESEDGEGTTFRVYLPVPDDVEVRRGTHEDPDSVERGRGERVLVVDDEPFILETAEEVLRDGGYRVLTASTGTAALRTVDANDVDVVITDLRMPEMDGLELIRALRARDPGLPIVAASGVADGRSEEALSAGAHRFLAKPFSEEVLLGALHEVLSSADETSQ